MGQRFGFLIPGAVAGAVVASSIAFAEAPKDGRPRGVANGQAVKAVAKLKKAKRPAQKPSPAPAAARDEVVEAVPAAPPAATETTVTVIAVPAAAPGAVAGNLEPLTQQFLQQFRPILRAEYRLIKVACALSKPQRVVIAREGERALKDAAARCAEVQNKMMHGGWQGNEQPDALNLIHGALAKAVKKHLPPGQAAAYLSEVEKRESFRRRAAVRNIIARLDQELVFAPDQRDKLDSSLNEHVKDAWRLSQQMLMYGDQFFPNLPERHVTPILNPNQKKVWSETQKFQGMVWGGFGVMGEVAGPEDAAMEDEDLAAARKDALAEKSREAGKTK